MPVNGFNKDWRNWGDINRMLDLGEEYLSKMRQNLFKGILHSITLQQYHAVKLLTLTDGLEINTIFDIT